MLQDLLVKHDPAQIKHLSPQAYAPEAESLAEKLQFAHFSHAEDASIVIWIEFVRNLSPVLAGRRTRYLPVAREFLSRLRDYTHSYA